MFRWKHYSSGIKRVRPSQFFRLESGVQPLLLGHHPVVYDLFIPCVAVATTMRTTSTTIDPGDCPLPGPANCQFFGHHLTLEITIQAPWLFPSKNEVFFKARRSRNVTAGTYTISESEFMPAGCLPQRITFWKQQRVRERTPFQDGNYITRDRIVPESLFQQASSFLQNLQK